MIKVLKHGRAHHTGRCPRCNARIAWTDSDGAKERRAVLDSTRGIKTYSEHSIQCPECGLFEKTEVFEDD